MSNNFTDIKTGLNHIGKSITGYSIYRSNSNNKFIISSYKSNRIIKKHLIFFSKIFFIYLLNLYIYYYYIFFIDILYKFKNKNQNLSVKYQSFVAR